MQKQDKMKSAKIELEEKIVKEDLVPNMFKPGEFIKPKKQSAYYTKIRHLSPNNWVFHDLIVKKVFEGDYFGIRPYSAEFVPTVNCTNRCVGPCSYCLQRMNEGIATKNNFKNAQVHMQSFEFAKNLADKLIDGGIKGIVVTGGGEPALFNNLENLGNYLKEKNTDWVLYTNGNTWTESRIKNIVEASPKLVRISLNCGTQEVYNKFHRPFNTRNTFQNVLNSIKWFAEGSLRNPEMTLGVSFIVNEVNKDDIPATAQRIYEIHEKTKGGIGFVTYRPAFNYNGSKQTDPKIIDEAYQKIEEDVKNILNGTGINIANIKCRFDTIKGEERGYDQCRSSGLFAELGPSGELYSCCDRNCFTPFMIGDLKVNTLEEIFSSSKRKEVLDYANDFYCTTCPLACKPHETNKQFHDIEQLKSKGELYKVEVWIDEQRKLPKPKMVNF